MNERFFLMGTKGYTTKLTASHLIHVKGHKNIVKNLQIKLKGLFSNKLVFQPRILLQKEVNSLYYNTIFLPSEYTMNLTCGYAIA